MVAHQIAELAVSGSNPEMLFQILREKWFTCGTEHTYQEGEVSLTPQEKLIFSKLLLSLRI